MVHTIYRLLIVCSSGKSCIQCAYVLRWESSSVDCMLALVVVKLWLLFKVCSVSPSVFRRQQFTFCSLISSDGEVWLYCVDFHRKLIAFWWYCIGECFFANMQFGLYNRFTYLGQLQNTMITFIRSVHVWYIPTKFLFFITLIVMVSFSYPIIVHKTLLKCQ